MARTSNSFPDTRPGPGSADPVCGGPTADQPGGLARFELFIAGNGLRSEAIEQGVRVALSIVSPGATLEVRDARNVPEAADRADVRMLPTLVRIHPAPQLRWIGEVGDADALVDAMRP